MSSKPSSLLRVPVEMPNRTGHNMSHSVSFSGKTGTLYPIFCEELLPNDTVSLGDVLQVQFPPMVTDFYGKVDFVLEAFFCPNRLCWGGWSDFITHPTANPVYPEGTQVQSKPTRVPYFYIGTVDPPTIPSYTVPRDSLLHYLRYGNVIDSRVQEDVSVLKAIAYHRIWDDWYRDSRVQAPLFYRASTGIGSDGSLTLRSLPFISTTSSGASLGLNPNNSFGDGVSLRSLRQRNWVKDYFTTCSPLPQAGGASEVKFDVSSATDTGAFSIATLRAANSLNLWRLS